MKNLEELLSQRESAAQEALNGTREDHRFFQGYRQGLEDLLNILNKATKR